MSSTRRKDPDDESFSQGRYASTSEYAPPLLCNLVARRARTLKNAEDRALVYFLQQASHREGGLERVAEEVVAMFPERLGTATMHRLGIGKGTQYGGEIVTRIYEELGWSNEVEDRVFASLSGSSYDDPFDYKAAVLAQSLRVEKALAGCRKGVARLPDVLRKICLDPETVLSGDEDSRTDKTVSVGWFNDLLGALRKYRHARVREAESAIAETTISSRVFDDLDYAAHCKGLVIIEGDQRTGKSTAAKNWCERHPGQAVYVKLGVGNDDASFFRSIARALGTASSLTRKPTEMMMKIEDALQEGHLMLVLDEAHFLFAQTQRPRSAPSRLDWVRTALVDFNVAVAFISTPQFDRSCKVYEKQLEWNAAQIRGRVKLKTLLPAELPAEDLVAVARKMAPHADEPSLERLVGFAQSSDDYLAGIERLVTRASYFAMKDGREVATRADIKRALDDAMPVFEVVAQPPAMPSRGQQGSVRAISRQKPCMGVANDVPPAFARRSGMNLPGTPVPGSEAGEQLQFSEAAASE